MAKLKFEDVELPITVEDIDKFEINMKLFLPQNFKNLILKYNGGLTDDSNLFDVLLSIKYGKQTIESVINTHQNIEKNIPKDYLPIASDWSDNTITICLKQGNDYGKIVKFYFDTDEKPETIAKSLEELLGVNSIDEL